jgi:hypothetical protein
MNLAALHLAIAAVVDCSDQVAANEFIKTIFGTFLDSLPMFIRDEPFSYPSSDQTLPADLATLGKHAHVQQAGLQIWR